MIKGTITLKDGSIIDINDDTIVSGSVKYSMSTSTGGQFDIGTFNAARLKIGIYDEQSAGREFDAAEIKLFEGDDTVGFKATGVYYVDGTQTDRRGKVVKLVAYDSAVKYDVAIPEELMGYSYEPKTIFQKLSEHVGVIFADFDEKQYPNYNASCEIGTSKAVQSCRDLIMWIAKFMCCNIVIDRQGVFTVRRVKYLSQDTAITVDHTFTADEREDITFSDIRTYIKYLTFYNFGEVKEMESSYTSSDAQARPGGFNLADNPCYPDRQGGDRTLSYKSWLKYIDGYKAREIKATVFDGQKVSLGDTCKFSGGKIDIDRSIISVVTDIERTYNGKTVIICRAPKAVEYEITAEEEEA